MSRDLLSVKAIQAAKPATKRLVLHDVACMVRHAIRHDLVQPVF